uniref:Uncharacterized protein n=1 Tax=Aegilops tauschii subsp. strangulata TaxID=200361 RepID=A0A453L5B9_AEGTS
EKAHVFLVEVALHLFVAIPNNDIAQKHDDDYEPAPSPPRLCCFRSAPLFLDLQPSRPASTAPASTPSRLSSPERHPPPAQAHEPSPPEISQRPGAPILVLDLPIQGTFHLILE